jgi:Peptidase M1 N-terminal domain
LLLFVIFLSAGGHSSNKKVVYDPNSLQRCQQLVLSRGRAIFIVSVLVGIFFVIALIAAFARPGLSTCDNQTTLPTTDADHTAGQPTAATATNGKPFPWNNIRLPETVVPLTYELFIWPNLTLFRFDGNVTVLLDVKTATDFLIFHSKELTIRSCTVNSVSAENSPGRTIRVLQTLEYIRNEQIYLQLDSKLLPGEKYQLLIDFNGTLTDSLAGFYRSSYETMSGEKR